MNAPLLFLLVRSRHVILSLALISASTHSGRSQATSISDGAHRLNWFDQSTGVENSGLINGFPYKMAFFSPFSNPFFLSGEVAGTIRYQQQWYNAKILYDTYQDEIAIKHFNLSGQVWLVQLTKGDIQEFVLDGHLFRNMDGSFYEVLFEGKFVQLLVKRSMTHESSGNGLDYKAHDEFYLLNNSHWTRVSKVSKMARILVSKTDRRKLDLFIRKENIRKGKRNESEMAQTASFLDGLAVNGFSL